MVRVTFGTISLNAQPLLEYNLRALYPFAHELIVVEGATRAATSLATEDGHSTDGTLDMLKRFKKEEDPANKLQIVSATDEGYLDGFWPEKEQMSQAYAKRTTGDWLWQVDSDEFYREDDVRVVLALLAERNETSGVSFPFIEFWGGFDYMTTGKWYLQDFTEVPRLFRWGLGYQYVNHRPPTVADSHGLPLGPRNWISANEMRKRKIFMYHYSYVFPKQAQQKVGYYTHVTWTEAFRKNQNWLQESFYGLRQPFFLSEKGFPILQWLERFRGEHPHAILQLKADLASGKVNEAQRPTADIEKVLNSLIYNLGTRLLHFLMPSYWHLRRRLRSKH